MTCLLQPTGGSLNEVREAGHLLRYITVVRMWFSVRGAAAPSMMDVLPVHVAVVVSAEKYLILAYECYQADIASRPEEPSLTFRAAKHIGIASLIVAVLNRARFDDGASATEQVLYVLPYLREIPYVTERDIGEVERAYRECMTFKIIREDASIIEFVAERAWWAAFHNYDYDPSSALHMFIERLLQSYEVWCRYELRCISGNA